MTDLEPAELASLLDEVRRELDETVDDLDRSRAAHRRVESLLLALLDHVPVPVVVVDEDLKVRAAGAAAEAAWGATLDGPLSALGALEGAGVPDACRAAFQVGHLAAGSVPGGFGAAMIDEPGTGMRYIAVWAG
jgi:PAS domain-containing protein